MHTNLDFAIASVIEHGQALDIPNVFAAYLQRVIACELSDGSTITETEAIARAALVSFERAMDKYPMAPPARSSKTKTKTKKTCVRGGVVAGACLVQSAVREPSGYGWADEIEGRGCMLWSCLSLPRS